MGKRSARTYHGARLHLPGSSAHVQRKQTRNKYNVLHYISCFMRSEARTQHQRRAYHDMHSELCTRPLRSVASSGHATDVAWTVAMRTKKEPHDGGGLQQVMHGHVQEKQIRHEYVPRHLQHCGCHESRPSLKPASKPGPVKECIWRKYDAYLRFPLSIQGYR